MSGKGSIEEYWNSREKELSKKFLKKLVLCILTTNLALFFALQQNSPIEKTITSEWKKLNSNESKKVVIKTQNFIHYTDPNKILEITVVDEKNEVISKKAWLHKTIKAEGFEGTENISYIEILNREIPLYIKNKSSKFKIYPYSSESHLTQKEKRNKYEIIF